jgi:hypothetical protein
VADQFFNLFALTNDPGARVLRVSVVQELQETITAMFKEQETKFLAGVEGDDFIKFDGKYRPEEKELLVIDDFDDLDKVADAILNPIGYDTFSVKDHGFDMLKGLFTGYVQDGKTRVLLQVFDRRRIISPKGLSIIHDQDKFRKLDGVGLTLDNKLTAILDDKRLLFSNFHFARQVFDLTAYFKDATDGDVREFCRLEAAPEAKRQAIMNACDTWVRRKIALVRQSGVLDSTPAEQIVKVALNFGLAVVTEVVDGKSVVSFPESRAELKRLLRFLDEDYYQSPLTENMFISNSKTAAPKPNK